jgi:rod shape-determining protein MreC
MNQKLFYFLSLIFLLYYSYLNQSTIREHILDFTDSIKISFVEMIEPFHRFYINLTSDEVTQLKVQNEKLTIIATSLLNDSNELRHSLKLPKLDIDLDIVKVISRSEFNDNHSFWIDYKDFNPSKIYGLIHNSYSAGIVININNRPKALLNFNNDCSYSVHIGKESIPGILNGSKSSKLIIDYIPQWLNVKVGDEVVTSGLDNIFPKGIKVGIVSEINTLSGYKQALVEPYNKRLQSRYYYISK